MSPQLKTTLITLGIIVGTIVGVSLGYNLYTNWDKNRALINKHKYILPAVRGEIQDVRGNVVALSEIVYDLYLDCTVIRDSTEWEEKTDSLAPLLAQRFPQRSATQWLDYMQDGRTKGRKFVSIAKSIKEEEISEIKSLPIFNMKSYKGGGIIQEREKRLYPYGELAKATIGFIGNADTVKVGIEWDYNYFLTGKKGEKTILSGRYEGRSIQKEVNHIPPINGGTIITTLDIDMQARSDAILRNVIDTNPDIESGCIIMMNVNSGAIRTMVSLAKDSESGRIHETKENIAHREFEPGSLTKVLPLAAALEDGFVHSLDDTIPTNHGVLPGFVNDAHIVDYERSSGKEFISILDGLALSSNYVFAYLANRFYSHSHDNLTNHFKMVCDYPGYELQLNKLPESYLRSQSIGYGFMMTPLSILNMYNTIANKGVKMKPYVIEELSGENRTMQAKNGPECLGQVLPVAVADTLSRALKYVVQNGTGKALKDVYPSCAGKTGTSRLIIDKMERGDTPYIDKKGCTKNAGSFVGFFPVEDPQYSIICVLFSYAGKRTMYGGTLPAQIIKEVVNYVYE